MRPRRLLQIAGLCAIATLGIDLWNDLKLSAPAGSERIWLRRVALAALCAFFAWAFVRSTRRSVDRPKASGFALLALQLAAALAMHTNFLVVLAAEIPFVLPGGFGIAAFAAQGLSMTALLLGAAGSDHVILWDAARGLPALEATLLTALGAFAWQAFAFFAGYAAASEERARRHLERANAELGAAQERLAEGSRTAERLRISRELHDRVGHHLALLAVHLELAKQLGGAAADPEAPLAATLRRAQAVARALLGEVREVVSRLRTERPLDLAEGLRLVTAGIPALRIDLQLPEPPPPIDPEAAADLVRAAQELITNAIRHAEATTLRLTLSADSRGVELQAADDGRGAADFVEGNGLAGLRERIGARGGSVRIDPRGADDAPGFTVRVRLPHGAAEGAS